MMKRKIAIMLCVICCLGLSACGKKEEQSSDVVEKTVAAVEEKSTEESVETDKESETVAPEVETSNEVIAETIEEVVGDVDIAPDGLTMADMQELEVGMDIPASERDEGTFSSYEGFKLLFPSGAYITNTNPGNVEAQLDSIWFILSAFTSKEENPSTVNIKEERGDTLETIGKYMIRKMPIRNSSNGLQYCYDIYDTETNSALSITLTINKNKEYQEYGDKLVEEYMPKFEEVLYNNLQ